jgi:hypothetical protein
MSDENVFDPTYGGADISDPNNYGYDYSGSGVDDPNNYGYNYSGYGVDDPNNYGYNYSGYGFDYGGTKDAVDTASGNRVIIYDDGSTLTVGPDGSPISATESKDAVGNSSSYNKVLAWTARNLGPTGVKALQAAMNNPGATAATALAGIKMMSGGNQVQTGGYSKPIPKLDAVREQIQYNDPNRRPGEGGRQYFTDTQYVPQGDAEAMAAAKAAATTQASGIQAAYQPRPAAAPNPYAGKMNLAFSTPSGAQTVAESAGKRAATQEAAALPQIPTELTEQGGLKMAEGGIADAGRYLQGKTDGMADEIPSSIDGEQPAALSHGEFVIPADVVSHLGNGNSEAGAQKLYEMMDRIRQARTGTKEQGKEINPDEFTMGGLAAAYAGGGAVQKFNTGNLVTATPPATPPATGVTGFGTSASSQLSPWAGDYVTNYLAQGAAMAATPYQAYKGPLTAGASDLQQQAFAGSSEIAGAGYTPTQFSGGLFNTQAAQQYMNPYLQASLDPQLKELNRQSQMQRMEDAGRLTKAGAYGGSRQAIMESEGRRNLLDKQAGILGTGYATAYDKAMQQFNADQSRQMEADKATEASRQYGADFGLKSVGQLADLGATQRGITGEGIAADKAQFEEQRDFAYKMPQYQKDLLQGLPITTTATTNNTTELGRITGQIADLQGLYDKLTKLGQTPATTPTTGAKT